MYTSTIQICYRSKYEWLWPFKVTQLLVKGKFDSAIGLPTYGFLLMFNSNIGPN